jgi:hypothetical protein
LSYGLKGEGPVPRDVLDELLSMTEENWEERCEELAEMLRAVAGDRK